jgi:predicted AlkP superfamily pyrophosphatase or phosphodiesterase
MIPDRRSLRKLAALALLCLPVLSLPVLSLPAKAAPPSPGSSAAARPPVKLAVIISVDGLGWSRLSAYRDWYSEGLKRLLTEGQVETACRYAHLNTETGPGHAALGTGAPPRITGIVANHWFEANPDGQGLRRLYCTDQPDTGRPPGTIPGPANLRVATLGDRLVEASPASRVVALSGKDRGAIFLAGKDPRHLVYWYDRDTGRFVSSAAYDQDGIAGSAGRELVKRFNRQQAGGRLVSRFGTLWKPLPEPPGAAAWPQPEPDLGHFQMTDMGIGFPHDLTGLPRGYFDGVFASPFQDQVLTDLALDFLASPAIGLGRRGVPDLLALSYSAHDVISHGFGNESAEELDTLRRLDHELGRLLAALDALAAEEPRGSVVLALSSDHGFAPLPEIVRRNTGRRIGGRLESGGGPETPYPSFQERLNRALDDELCLPDGTQTLYGLAGWSVTYNRSAFPAATVEGPCGPAGRTVTVADLDRVFPGVVRKLFAEEIKDVLLVSQRGHWPADGPASFVRNDFDPQRSGDAFLIPREEVLMHVDAERGSGHGSLYEYDIHVPLIFWGGPFHASEKAETSAPYDLAPTLADVLGIKLPDAVGVSRR